MLKVGALFAGYLGLEMGVQSVLGGDLAWVSEIDKGACKILAHRAPNVPNLGDITTVDWSAVEPVDILTGGSPCQDLSHAGKRGGMTEGTRSNLWVAMREAIAQLRPSLVIWENVEGAASAEADSDMEPCAGCLGGARDRGPSLRALGRVVGDLSSLGYVGQVRSVRAADVGAPHGRRRRFLAAHPASDAGWFQHGDGAIAALADDRGPRPRRAWANGRPELVDGLRGGELLPTPTSRDHKGRNQRDDESCLAGALLPTPRASDGEKGGPNQRGSSGDLMLPSAVTLLPTPAVNDMGEGKTPEAWDEWTARMKAAHGNGNGHGASLAIEAQRLLPTPSGNDDNRGERSEAALLRGDRQENLNDLPRLLAMRWGQYADAIARWEHLTRPAPPPTQPSKKGTPQLSARFSEWLMGLPAGWVTDVPGITRNEALKAIGNGVCPQQCAAALRLMLATEAAA